MYRTCMFNLLEVIIGMALQAIATVLLLIIVHKCFIYVVNSDLSAEQYGEGSRCFDHSTRWTVGGEQTNPFGAGCYQVGLLNIVTA